MPAAPLVQNKMYDDGGKKNNTKDDHQGSGVINFNA
jgi:hypothetical protein